MTCSGNKEPKGSASSSTDFVRCRCDHYQMNHRPFTEGGCRNCACETFALKVEEPEPRCEGCGHTEGEGCGCPPRCTCGCPRGSHMGKPQGCIPHGFHEYSEVPEPPLTPEEEEEAPEDRCTCGETACESELCDCDSVPCPVDHAAEELAEGPPCSEVEGCDGNCCAKAPPPPQPDRRPPTLVAYSVQGHLYEVALPGDATVQAVDGALVITHALGPVNGIVQCAPMEKEGA